jgi:hypothetical protein
MKVIGLLGLLCGVLAWPAVAVPPVFTPPADSGVANVVTDFGAVGDGVTDDTQAIQRAISAQLDEGRYGTPRFVYLPAGEYLVTGPLTGQLEPHGWSGGWRAGMILVGESPETTAIRLADNAEGYGDPESPKYVVATGSESDRRTGPDDEPLSGGGNRAFRHNIMNLTIDVGEDNPGAIALDYVVSNRGTVRNVHLVAPEGSGHTGLNMTRHWPGPGYIVDVVIDGFDYGMRVSHSQYGMTFEDITLRNQRVAGITNTHNMLAIHRLTSDNEVPAFDTSGERGLIVLLDSQLTGGSGDAAAITGRNRVLARNVTAAGYAALYHNPHDDIREPAQPEPVEVFVSHGPHNLTPDRIDPTWRIQPEMAPQYQPEGPDDWVSVTEFGATTGGDDDDTAGIQAAIDSGTPVVYLPRGSYRITEPIRVHGPTRLIIGFQSSISLPEELRGEVPSIIYAGAEGESTIIEHIWTRGHVQHEGAGTLTVRHMDLGRGYRNTESGTGDLFTEDTIGKPWHFNHPQRAFLRQINCEFGEDPLIENHGADIWFLGYKTEGEMVCYRQTAGSADMNGTLFYPLGNRNPRGPAVLIEQGEFAGSLRMNSRGYQLFAGAAMGDENQAIRWRDVGNHAAPLVLANVPEAGLAAAIAVGELPSWSQQQGNPFTGPHGYRWLAVNAGSTNNWTDPAAWSPLGRYNPGAGRWERDSVQDQAPSYHPGTRALRTRPAGGHIGGLVIQPPDRGSYTLAGRAHITTWGPDAPMRVLVIHVDDNNTGRVLYDGQTPDNGSMDWNAIDNLRNLRLGPGESIAILGASTGGGTGTIDFDHYRDHPTRLVPAE